VNKFVAKIASDYNKPNGQKTLEDVIALEELPIQNFMVLEKY
jgi:DNA polymerase-4